MWFPNGSVTNRAVQDGYELEILDLESRGIAKTKAPISFAVTAKLICVFVFA